MNCPIDFSLLYTETNGYAVHCKTKEEAMEFIDWARQLYPGLCKEWGHDTYNYDTHREKTIYTFDSHYGGRWNKSRLMYGSVSAATDMGYTVIEFEDICNRPDIEESDKSLDFLFGGAV